MEPECAMRRGPSSRYNDAGMLEPRRFGTVRFYPGGRDARFPYSNTLVIEDQGRVVVDPCAGRERLAEEIPRGADLLINTHSHGDHVRGNGYFPDAEQWVPRLERYCFGDYAAWGRSLGIEAVFGADENARFAAACETGEMTMRHPIRVHPETVKVMGRLPAAVYDDGHEWRVGDTRIRAIHVPGHTVGLMALHFPDVGAVFVTDFDLTPFGPWYGQPESDPDAFLASADKLRKLDVEWFITSHEYGYLPRAEFMAELDRFMAVIHRRDEHIASLSHLDEEAILRSGAVYYQHLIDRDPWIYMMGTIMVRKHLKRLGVKA